MTHCSGVIHLYFVEQTYISRSSSALPLITVTLFTPANMDSIQLLIITETITKLCDVTPLNVCLRKCVNNMCESLQLHYIKWNTFQPCHIITYYYISMLHPVGHYHSFYRNTFVGLYSQNY